MPRRPRLVCQGMPHHVTQRGNYQQNVFESQEDFRRYCYLVLEYQAEYKIDVISYCLMRNHVHFIVIPETKEGLSGFISVVHMNYSKYKNSINNKKGHLWQSRFFSSVLDDKYLFHAVRYVEQNPLRAGIVHYPWDYIWSSAREHVHLEKAPIIKTVHAEKIQSMLGRGNWREYLSNEDLDLNDLIRAKTKRGSVLATEDFIKDMEQKLGRPLADYKQGRPKKGTATFFTVLG